MRLETELWKNLNYPKMIFLILEPLHSLAFRRLGIKKENVMQKHHYQDLGQKD